MSRETPENTTNNSALQFKKRREQKEQGEDLTLSSGIVVRIRRPEVSKLIAEGQIPANLVQVFLSVQGKQPDGMKPEDLTKLLQFQRIVARHAFIQPVIRDEPNYDNGEISLEDIDEDDLQDVWAYVNGGLTAVESFRSQRAGVLPRPDSDPLPEPKTK